MERQIDTRITDYLEVNDRALLIQLYRWIRTSRFIDLKERELIARGEAFFHVSGMGHESTAALALFLSDGDYLHLHYRDKALMLARGIPVQEFFNSLVCNAASHSAGRQMSAHLSATDLNILSLVGPVGNNALQAAGIAAQIKSQHSNNIVICSLGDGTTQQGEVLEAIAECVRSTLPVLFLIQDNQLAISTRTTGKTFYSLPSGDEETFYGIGITRIDGTRIENSIDAFEHVVQNIRTTGMPAICVLNVERLSSHTNADDEFVYRDLASVSKARESADPVENLARLLLRKHIDKDELEALDAEIETRVRIASEAALVEPAPLAAYEAKKVLPQFLFDRLAESPVSDSFQKLTIAEALRDTLRVHMESDEAVTLYGEDIEDPKGDVFGITRGLSTAFPDRVQNSPLSESTIIGTSIGRALAGGRPVAFLQFADFIPLAFNQIATELATMEWRTQGRWAAPVIVMVPCGGYRPGLGPFHAHTFDSVIAHLPGIDCMMPSTAADAAGMLSAAFRSRRPSVLFYPKALLNDRSRANSLDVARQFTPVGAARLVRPGTDITLVAWGNCVPLCEKAATAFAEFGLSVEVIDLRWLSPWDKETVQRSVAKTGKLLVIHEDNESGGFAAEVLASVAETSARPIKVRRIARPDTFVPCHFGNQIEILPSLRRTLEVVAEMLECDIRWEGTLRDEAGREVVRVIGSSPADQTVEIVEINVGVGEVVKSGQALASVEADKAVVEMASPANGTVATIHLKLGDKVPIDTPLMTLEVDHARQRQPNAEQIDRPYITRRGPKPDPDRRDQGAYEIVITGIGTCKGVDRLENAALLKSLPKFAGDDPAVDGIYERTGIKARLVAGPGQDAVSMGVDAANKALDEAGIRPSELSLIICSTSTPPMVVPSTACLLLEKIAPNVEIPAFDLMAACSGYLYALTSAWDFLQQNPDAHVPVVTTESMRGITDIEDPETSPIFADAATATILSAKSAGKVGLATVLRPVISARGENGTNLSVPQSAPGVYVKMDGKKIFTEAIRKMCQTLSDACAKSDLSLDDLDLIIPHQANGRIIEAMQRRLKFSEDKIWNEIRDNGNTSSSSIPLALDTVLRADNAFNTVGLTAFGGGYTFAGAILKKT